MDDISGQVFGRLTVVEYANRGKWRCRCKCGSERVLKRSRFAGGKTQSCGCLRHELHMERRSKASKVRVAVGERFGMLRVAGYTFPDQYVKCVCDCGNQSSPTIGNLRRGLSRSCGCTRYSHLKSGTEEHRIWLQMRYRCSAQTSPDYARYGGRGIKVCARWDSFEAFMEDMGPRPSQLHSLDRVDNSGNYEPGNVRWASKTEQARNRYDTLMSEFNGRTQSLAAWAEECGLVYSTVVHRLERGWTIEQALSRRAGDGIKPSGKPSPIPIEIGMRFGKLTVVALPKKSLRATCLCECGKTTSTFKDALRRRASRSCGCSMGKHVSESRKRRRNA